MPNTTRTTNMAVTPLLKPTFIVVDDDCPVWSLVPLFGPHFLPGTPFTVGQVQETTPLTMLKIDEFDSHQLVQDAESTMKSSHSDILFLLVFFVVGG